MPGQGSSSPEQIDANKMVWLNAKDIWERRSFWFCRWDISRDAPKTGFTNAEILVSDRIVSS